MKDPRLKAAVEAAVPRILDHLVNRHAWEHRRAGRVLEGNCPWRPGADSEGFHIVIETGGFKDHASDETGDIVRLWARWQQLDSDGDAIKEIAAFLGFDQDAPTQPAIEGDAITQLAHHRRWNERLIRRSGAACARYDNADEVRFPMHRWGRGGWKISGWRRRAADNGLLQPKTGQNAKPAKALTMREKSSPRANGVMACPWPLPEDGVVLLVEGEADMCAAASAGAPAVVATPGASPGGQVWEAIQQLLVRREVVLVPQADRASARWRDAAGAALEATQCSIRYVPAGVPKRDLDDLLKHAPEPEEALAGILDKAVSWEPSVIEVVADRALGQYDLSDTGNVGRFAAAFRDRLCYVPSLGWCYYDRGTWRPDEGNIRVIRAASSIHKAVRAEAEAETDKDRQRALVKWMHRCQDRGRINAMVDLARAAHGLSAAESDFDQRSDLLNAANGYIDLHTGELVEHELDRQAPGRPRFMRCAGGEFDPAADQGLIARVVHEVMEGQEDLVDWLQRFLGYCATGGVEARIWAMWTGVGSNGKDTLLEALLAALGTYAERVKSELFLEGQTADPNAASPETARLKGLRLAVASELPETARLNMSVIKQLTGGDTLTARRLHRDPISFPSTHKLLATTNYQPTASADDQAMWDRLRVVPFRRRFTGDNADPHIKSKLAEQAEGTLAWIVEGAIAYCQQGLDPMPEAVSAAGEEYRKAEDQLQSWIDEECRVGEYEREPFDPLYKAYRAWMDRKGLKRETLSAVLLARRLDRMGFPSHKTKGPRFRIGLSLKRDEDDSANGWLREIYGA